MGMGINMDTGVAPLQPEKPPSIADALKSPSLATDAPTTPKSPVDLSGGREERHTHSQTHPNKPSYIITCI